MAAGHSPDQMKANHYQQIQRLLQDGEIAAAKQACLVLLQGDDRDVDGWWLLAQINAGQAAYREAESCYRKIVELQPGNHAAHLYQGLARVFQGRTAAAVECLQRAISLNPQFAPAYDYLGCALRDLGRHEEAIRMFRRALAIDGRLVAALQNLGNQLNILGRLDEAEQCYRRILEIEPAHQEAVAGCAAILEKQARFDAAFGLVRGLVERGESNYMAALVFATLAPRFDSLAEAAQVVRQALERQDLAPVQRQELLFSLGRTLDALGDYPKAFRAYRQANEMQPLEYDIGAHNHRVDSIIDYFSPERLASLPVAANRSQRPVFIVGMPRSGTSLVEQILASHHAVFGAGELDRIAMLVREAGREKVPELPFPQLLDNCSAASMDRFAGAYLSGLEALDRSADRVTDKMPGNYLYLGMIQLLFPAARIIHCVRNPLDTCLSCYFQNFGPRHVYSSSLGLLGQVYNHYRKLMRHWEGVLTLPICTIEYESLVGDLEPSARRLVEFCGLEWDAQCLDFHKSGRLQSTASYNQVRRPLYRSSVQRWKNYVDSLGELRDMLDSD